MASLLNLSGTELLESIYDGSQHAFRYYAEDFTSRSSSFPTLAVVSTLFERGALLAGQVLSWTVGVIGAILAVLVFICFAAFVYRLTLHPLAKYPGPFLSKFSYHYLAYHSWRGDVHVDIWRAHEKYGSIVRYGANCVLFNSADALQTIYHSKQCKKPDGYKIMNMKAASTFSETDPKIHSGRRRLLSAGFSDAALRSYEPRMLENVRKFLRKILEPAKSDQAWTGPQDFGDLVGHLSFDIMTSVVYGTSYNLIEDPQHRHVMGAMEKLNVRTGVLIASPMMAWARVDRFLFRRAIKNRNFFVEFVLRVLNERKKDVHRKDDAFSVLMNSRDSETGLCVDDKLLASESSNLIMAGSDTAATAFAAIGFYLSRYRDAYDKVAEEVRSRFNHVSEVHTGPLLNGCQYLRACIMESMRLSPSVGSTLWREVLPGGMSIDGHFLPEGVVVGTSIYSIHHHEAYFEDPFVFKPERWLPGSKDSASPEARLAWNPFSIGPRGCIGKALAMNELLLTFAALFVATDFRVPICQDARKGEGSTDAEYGRHRIHEYQMPHYLMACRNGPMMEFRARQGREL